MTAPEVRTETSPTLATNHRPARVSKDLRSSTATIRRNGMRAMRACGGDVCSGLAGGLALRVWGSCCCSFSLGVGGELEEHLLETGRLGGS